MSRGLGDLYKRQVNDDDQQIRQIRLNLLALICAKIRIIADFEKIEK